MSDDTIDPETLRELLKYDAATGALTWKRRDREYFSSDSYCRSWNTRYAGNAAFTALDGTGYYRGSLFGKLFLAHRVSWAVHYGDWPEGEIDHQNGVRTDNRIKNLRDCPQGENARNHKRRCNNTSGVTGVYWQQEAGKWRAIIRADNRIQHLGYFDDKNDAIAARAEAEKRFGYHPNHGRA